MNTETTLKIANLAKKRAKKGVYFYLSHPSTFANSVNGIIYSSLKKVLQDGKMLSEVYLQTIYVRAATDMGVKMIYKFGSYNGSKRQESVEHYNNLVDEYRAERRGLFNKGLE